jgi:hypothetical protein
MVGAHTNSVPWGHATIDRNLGRYLRRSHPIGLKIAYAHLGCRVSRALGGRSRNMDLEERVAQPGPVFCEQSRDLLERLERPFKSCSCCTNNSSRR